MLHPMYVFAQNDDGETTAIYNFFFDLTEDATLATLLDSVVTPFWRILLILLLAYIANRVVRRLIKRSIRRLAAEGGLSKLGALKHRGPLKDTTPMDIGRLSMRAETVAGVLRSLGTVAIWSIAVIMIMDQLGLALGPLIAGAGIVGVALGFGAQKLVQDFLSGIFMLIEDQYGLGDIIDTGEAIGIVEGISLRTTRVRDIEGTVWHIPNGQIARIGNYSQQWARALLDVGVAYATDIPTAIDIIKRTADEVWRDEEWSAYVLDEPEVWGVEAFKDSEIAIRLVVKTLPGEQWMVSRELRKRLKVAFDAEGIEIPFPQRTLWWGDSNGSGRPDGAASEQPRAAALQDQGPASPREYGRDAKLPDGDADGS